MDINPHQKHTNWNCPPVPLYNNVTAVFPRQQQGNTHTHTHTLLYVAIEGRKIQREGEEGVAMRQRLQADLGTRCKLSHQDTRRHIFSIFLSRLTDDRLQF